MCDTNEKRKKQKKSKKNRLFNKVFCPLLTKTPWKRQSDQCLQCYKLCQMFHVNKAESRQVKKSGDVDLWRRTNRLDIRAARCWRMFKSPKMVVLHTLQHLHLSHRAHDRDYFSCLRVYLLPKRTGIGTEWPEAEGTEGATRKGRVWGYFYDRS